MPKREPVRRISKLGESQIAILRALVSQSHVPLADTEIAAALDGALTVGAVRKALVPLVTRRLVRRWGRGRAEYSAGAAATVALAEYDRRHP